MGTVIEGKIESGSIRKGSTQLIMPNKTQVEIMGVYTEADEEMVVATSGDQVRLRIKGVEEEELSVGFVLSSPKAPVHVVSVFEAQVAIIELKTLLSAGYTCVMHVHTAVEEVTFDVTPRSCATLMFRLFYIN
jgi:peptide chain release factor subunit 3